MYKLNVTFSLQLLSQSDQTPKRLKGLKDFINQKCVMGIFHGTFILQYFSEKVYVS